MEQYIKKSALVAEINKLYNGEIDTYTRDILDRLKSNIDTLEMKSVDLDLEITLWANAIPEIRLDDVEKLAKHFFELGMAVSNKQIEEKEDINSPEKECNTVYKDITMIDRDRNRIKTRIEQKKNKL